MKLLKEGSRTTGYTIVGILILAVIAVIAIFAFGGVARLTAPFRGETEKIERTEGSGAFRQATYEEFYDLCAAVQDAEGRISNLEKELDGDPGEHRVTQINSSLTAVRNSRIESINAYNSKASQEHRNSFRDADLPARLDRTTEETQCAA